MRATSDTFLKRKDKFFFAKLERKHSAEELRSYFVANFVSSDNLWSGNLATLESEKHFTEWQKRIQSMKYIFEQECYKLKDYMERNAMQFDTLFDCSSGHPPLLKLYLRKDISLESMSILDAILKFSKKWNRDMKDDIVWQNTDKVVTKYMPFLNLDVTPYKKILRDVFIDS